MCIIDHTGLSTINYCCFVVWISHRPILVVINIEIGIVILSPTLLNAKSPLHIYEVDKLLISQRTLVSHNILMRCKWHRLRELPFTASYHLAQFVVISQFHKSQITFSSIGNTSINRSWASAFFNSNQEYSPVSAFLK